MPVSPYTQERLMEAASSSRTLSEALTKLGVDPKSSSRPYLLDRMKRESVANSRSLAELLRKLGRRDNGHQRKLLRQWIAEEGLTTAHFLGQGHQRGMPSTTPSRRPTDVLVKHDGKRRTKTVLLRRALSAIGVPERCAECGTSPVRVEIRSPWRSTTSTATGTMTAPRIAASCARTATQSPAPGAEGVHAEQHTLKTRSPPHQPARYDDRQPAAVVQWRHSRLRICGP